MNLVERLRNLQEEEHSKLTIGAFFEFMRTAYQVNDSFEGVATILNANSEIDWHELTKINLNLETHQDNGRTYHDNYDVKTQEQHKDNILARDLSLRSTSNKLTSPCTSESIVSSQFSAISSSTSIYETSDKDNSIQKPNDTENSSNECLKTKDNIRDEKQLSKSQVGNEEEKSTQPKEHAEESGYGLAKVMKENLRDILHEGLLDSVLPYMLPKSSLSQPVIKKSTATTDAKKSASTGNIVENKSAALTHKEKDKEKNKTNKKLLE